MRALVAVVPNVAGPQRGLGCGWSGLIRASRLVMIMTVAQYTIASWCSGRRS